MKSQAGIHFSWGLVITLIVAIVILAIVFIFVYPKVTAGGFNESAAGFGQWVVKIFSVD